VRRTGARCCGPVGTTVAGTRLHICLYSFCLFHNVPVSHSSLYLMGFPYCILLSTPFFILSKICLMLCSVCSFVSTSSFLYPLPSLACCFIHTLLNQFRLILYRLQNLHSFSSSSFISLNFLHSFFIICYIRSFSPSFLYPLHYFLFCFPSALSPLHRYSILLLMLIFSI
jgi:hypothetical protein